MRRRVRAITTIIEPYKYLPCELELAATRFAAYSVGALSIPLCDPDSMSGRTYTPAARSCTCREVDVTMAVV